MLPNTYFSNTTKRMFYYDKQKAAFPLQSNNSVSHSRFESQPEFESTCCKIRLEEWLVWIPCMIWDFRAKSFPILFLASSKCNLCSTISCIPLILIVIQLFAHTSEHKSLPCLLYALEAELHPLLIYFSNFVTWSLNLELWQTWQVCLCTWYASMYACTGRMAQTHAQYKPCKFVCMQQGYVYAARSFCLQLT